MGRHVLIKRTNYHTDNKVGTAIEDQKSHNTLSKQCPSYHNKKQWECDNSLTITLTLTTLGTAIEY